MTTPRNADRFPDPPADVREIPLASIIVGEQNLRTPADEDQIEELALDIQARGLLQPIGVFAATAKTFQLLYGSRRLAAHRYLNRSTVLARIHPRTTDVKAVALVENIHRAQLTIEEEVLAITHLHDQEHRSPEQIASLCSKSRAWVMRRLSIPQLPDDLRTHALAGRLTLGAVEEIARLPDPSQRAWLAAQAETSKLTVHEIRAARQSIEATNAEPEQLEPAVRAGMNAPPPPTIYLQCQACHQPREPQQLTLIRVCSDGCQHADQPTQ